MRISSEEENNQVLKVIEYIMDSDPESSSYLGKMLSQLVTDVTEFEKRYITEV